MTERRLTMTTTTAIAYLRVSKGDQELGIDAQRAAIATWCDSNDTSLVGEFTDQGVSGGAALDKRVELLKAVDALTEGAILVVAKRDRLTRDLVIGAMIESLVERKRATVRSADGIGNGNSPEAGMMRGLVDVFSSYERAVIRSRTRAALAVKKSRGEKTGGDVPFGYRAVRGQLEPVALEQDIIERARELRSSGLSLRKVAGQLAELGFTPRNGGGFHPQQISNMLV